MGWESAPPPWLPKAKQGNAFSDHKRHRLILVQEVGCCLAVQPQRLSKLPPYIARVLVLFTGDLQFMARQQFLPACRVVCM